jgi:fumarylacetoacetate (FAA) hydrolase
VGDGYAAKPVSLDRVYLEFSDALSGPCAPLATNAKQALDFAGALAVVTGDIPRLASAGQALDGVQLVMLANHVRVRNADNSTQVPALSSAFGPVAVTADEFVWSGNNTWREGRLNLNIQCKLNGRSVGKGNVGEGMTSPFGDLLARLCQTRRLCPGSILSSGEVRFADAASGFCSLAARREFEQVQKGSSQTLWLDAGDALLLEVIGPDGQSVFGAISQTVSAAA